MNLDDPNHPWSRLTRAVRQAREDRDAAAPYGFATRVAALAMAQERRVVSLFEAFALRAVAISGLLALASVAVNYSAFNSLTATPTTRTAVVDDEAAGADDALAAVLDLGD